MQAPESRIPVNQQRATDLMMYGMPELNPPLAHPYQLPAGVRRLNLVVPTLAPQASFTGLENARRLFTNLLQRFDCGRILVTQEALESGALEQWPEWKIGGEFAQRQIVFLGHQDEPGVPVAENDFFLAASWHSVSFIRSLRLQQQALSGMKPKRFVYLIQDYEPLFYPASPQYCLAEASYAKPDEMIAVFDTRELADYFARRGLEFPHQFVHEPMLHPTLDALRTERRDAHKERVIFLHVRPSLMRNGFRFLIEGIKRWAKTYPQAAQWSVVSAGGKHPILHLTPEVVVRPLHRLTLEDYAALLSRAWVGVSLRFSAHPGQVAQEIAEFGAWSITNACESRQPAAIAPNMLALSELSPRAIATALATCCSRFQPGRTSVIDTEQRIFRPAGEEFEFIDALASEWRQDDRGDTDRRQSPSVVPTRDDASASPAPTQTASDGAAATTGDNQWLSEDDFRDSALGADSELLALLGRC